MKYNEFISEAKLKKTFNVIIHGNSYKIIRDYHVTTPRGSLPMARDAGMSILKYTIIIEKALPDMVSDDTYSITWPSNNRNNIISLTKTKDTFNVFGAILKSNDKIDSLYPKATNRINLGNIEF